MKHWELIIYQSKNGVELDNEIVIKCESHRECIDVFNSIVNYIPHYHEMITIEVDPEQPDIFLD